MGTIQVITPAEVDDRLSRKATLDANGIVLSSQLPSYVDDIVPYPTREDFPDPGDPSKIYVAQDTSVQWRWDETLGYVDLVSSPGSTDAVPEGTVNKYFTDARALGAVAPQLVAKIKYRGPYADNTHYDAYDAVDADGGGTWLCLQPHTSSGGAPNVESPFWHKIGGTSNVVVGTGSGQAADAADTLEALGGKLENGFAGAVAGTTFTVLYVAGVGWPPRPTTRADVFVHWVDTTGEGTTTPAGILAGDTITRLGTGDGGGGTVTEITFRSASSIAPTGTADYFTNPLQLAAPAGLAVDDYYAVGVCFASLPPGSGFVVPTDWDRLTPVAAAGQDFAVFGRKITDSTVLAAVQNVGWKPNTTTATRAVACGVALKDVASVGTGTAPTYANPISSPLTLDTATGDATLQVVWTGDAPTSSHAVHSSVDGTLLVQAMTKTTATDPTVDNVLSISLNGTQVAFNPAATFGGSTNIPMTKA